MSTEKNPRIVVDPEVHFGRPAWRGLAPARDVLELVQDGGSFETITTDYYPDLDEADVKACVQYAINILDTEEIYVSTSTS